jgi:hypothetical protein
MLTIGAALADPVDSVTNLPIHPAFAGEDPMPDTMVCGKKAQKAFARTPAGKQIKTATVIAYYRAKLPASAKYTHTVVQGTSQDIFVSADGSWEVTVTGTPKSDGVYAISFGRFTPPLTPNEGASFGRVKLVCG